TASRRRRRASAPCCRVSTNSAPSIISTRWRSSSARCRRGRAAAPTPGRGSSGWHDRHRISALPRPARQPIFQVICWRIVMLARDDDILKAAEDWRRQGRGVALATVVETWGSAPRPVGSNLVIDQEGNFLGSVSGGCVEGAVVTEAIDVIESGKPKMLEFGVADETAWKVGLSCGGTIRVFVEKVE